MTSPHPFFTAFVFIVVSAATVFAQQTVRFANGLTYNDFYSVTVVDGSGERYTLFDVAVFDGEGPPWPGPEGRFGVTPGSGPPEGMKYFFWIRRFGDTGAISYPLSFRKISQIQFTGPGGRGPIGLGPGTAGADSVRRIENATLVVGEDERPVKVRIDDRRIYGWFGVKEPAVPAYTPAVLTLTDGSEQIVHVKTDGFLGGIDEDFGTYGLLWLMHDDIERIIFNHSGRYQRCPECGAIFYDEGESNCPFDGTALNASEGQ